MKKDLKMNNVEKLTKKVRTRWIVFWVGIAIILLGVALMGFAPQTFLQLRWEIVFFFIPTGWAAAELVKLSAIRKSPEAALREKVQNTDERMLSLRMHAGNTAFFVTLALSIIALLVYSFLSKPQNAGLDWTWNYLAFMVVVPLVVYVIALIRYNARN
jgi:hypothetical protein